MPWETSVEGQHLTIDLTPGIRSDEWERLFDATMFAVASAQLVTFLLPEGFELGNQDALLDNLVQSITSRGVHVERRQMPGPGGSD